MMRLLVTINISIFILLYKDIQVALPLSVFFYFYIKCIIKSVYVCSGLCAEDFISKRPLYVLMRDATGNILIFSHIHPPISAETARPGPGGPERERERESMRKVKGNEDERKGSREKQRGEKM